MADGAANPKPTPALISSMWCVSATIDRLGRRDQFYHLVDGGVSLALAPDRQFAIHETTIATSTMARPNKACLIDLGHRKRFHPRQRFEANRLAARIRFLPVVLIQNKVPVI
jgi:hypothetical protein